MCITWQKCQTDMQSGKKQTMKFCRREFLGLAAGTAALSTLPATAQTYPSRPVRVVVGAIPGSAPDVSARLVADWLSRRLGQTFFVENRNGASGNLAAEEVVGAPPDGHTLLLASASNAINVTLYDNLKFNFLSDFARSPASSDFPWCSP